jgi:probable HAF family extracellular repeat protein
MRKSTQHHRSRRSPRPLHLLVLEDRCLLSTYTITDLGSLGTGWSMAHAINDAGMVVGEFYSPQIGSHIRPFLWDTASGMQDLGTLGGPYDSAAYGINSKGFVVGRASTSDRDPDHAFLYDGGPLIDLGTLGGTSSWARGINNAGQVVGSSYTGSPFEGEHAFLWDADHGMQDLGTLAGPVSVAYGINDAGSVVGFSYAPGGLHAFIWDSDNGMRDLGTLGGPVSAASAINSLGHVVGVAERADGYDVAFFYDGKTMVDIGQPSPSSSAAAAINDSDQIVGTLRVQAVISEHGFVYADGRIQDLNGLIPPDSGFIVTSAEGINDAGQIVGTALDVRNQDHAVLLTPDDSGAPRRAGPGILQLLVSAPEASRGVEAGIQRPANAVPERTAADTVAAMPTDAAVRRAADAVFAGSHRSQPTRQVDGWEVDSLTENWMADRGENRVAADICGW